LNGFVVYPTEKQKCNDLVDIINDDIAPSVPLIREELEIFIIFNKIAEQLRKEGVGNEHG
jgi:hypothetical protein